MKLNRILPIVALSGIASVTVPLTTLCGCTVYIGGGDTPEPEPEPGDYVILDNFVGTEEVLDGLPALESQTFDTSFDEMYTIKTDLSKWDGSDFSSRRWAFTAILTVPNEGIRVTTLFDPESINNSSVTVGTTNLIYIPSASSLEKGQFSYNDDGVGGTSFAFGAVGEITEKTQTIIFKFKLLYDPTFDEYDDMKVTFALTFLSY